MRSPWRITGANANPEPVRRVKPLERRDGGTEHEQVTDAFAGRFVSPAEPHDHASLSGDWFMAAVLAAPFLFAAVAYLAAAVVQSRRGTPWPLSRCGLWLAGITVAACGFVGPLAEAAHGSFRAHTLAHVLVGMAAPVLLVAAAPVTLALRTLSVVPARRLARLLRGPLGRIFGNPFVALVLNLGGLWVLHTTPLYELSQRSALVHLAVMAHFLVAGFLFTASVVPVDPAPHRSPLGVRAGVLLAAIAAHGMLAKLLAASPPTGVGSGEALAGAQLMFYAGDAVDLVLLVALGAEWYRSEGRRMRRAAHPITVRGGAT